MTNTELDVKSLPGANFFVASALGANIADNEYMAETATIRQQNTAGKNKFDYSVKQWVNDATNARNAKQPLPPKPISPASTLVVRQDVDSGSWIAQTPGPVFGVCPDLPAEEAYVQGTPFSSLPVGVLTIEQKLDDLRITVHGIADALAKQGIR